MYILYMHTAGVHGATSATVECVRSCCCNGCVTHFRCLCVEKGNFKLDNTQSI